MLIPALILARGGSKGIPGKNMQRVAGVSLVGRCVKTAVAAGLSPVYVWSDCKKIRAEAERWGALAPVRPAEFSGDNISTEDTVKAFLKLVDPDKKIDPLALLQCTTPFLRVEHLVAVVEDYTVNVRDSVVTAAQFGRFLGYPSWDKKTEYIPMRPYRTLRQQKTPDFRMENGAVYLAKRKLWQEGRRIGLRCGVVFMSWWDSLEIDDPEDLAVANAIGALPSSSSCDTDSTPVPVAAPGPAEAGPVSWVAHKKDDLTYLLKQKRDGRLKGI